MACADSFAKAQKEAPVFSTRSDNKTPEADTSVGILLPGDGQTGMRRDSAVKLVMIWQVRVLPVQITQLAL
jgi:hypothetical protein